MRNSEPRDFIPDLEGREEGRGGDGVCGGLEGACLDEKSGSAALLNTMLAGKRLQGCPLEQVDMQAREEGVSW